MHRKMKKLPIGIQTFSEIINNNYIYIDKTEEALDLISNYKYVFLSRPRRFGKSLFLDTLNEIFNGSRDLFKGLHIHDKYDFPVHPVIRISFSGDLRSGAGLKSRLFDILDTNQQELNIKCKRPDVFDSCFAELIKKTCEKYKKGVVILIDEYDKAILDNLDQMDVAGENGEIIKSFYSVMKDCDKYIRFVFLTGVTKFSKTSIFSGLNNITDVSLVPKYGKICGYTHEDLQTSFAGHLKGQDYDKIREWYNGYNFLGPRVYNPFDILLFINNNFQFNNYWFETGTPSFLIKLLKNNCYFLPRLESFDVDENLANTFDIDELSIETILFQSGYLTIKKVKERRSRFIYTLSYPNKETRLSFNDYLLNYFVDRIEKNLVLDNLYDIFETCDMDKLEATLHRLFASIAYNNFSNNYIENYEGFYASVIYAYLASLGLDIIAEDVTVKGRIDLTVIFRDKVYIFEFKMNDEDPLKQIKERCYADKYSDRAVYLIGIVFNKQQRNIQKFIWESK